MMKYLNGSSGESPLESHARVTSTWFMMPKLEFLDCNLDLSFCCKREASNRKDKQQRQPFWHLVSAYYWALSYSRLFDQERRAPPGHRKAFNWFNLSKFEKVILIVRSNKSNCKVSTLKFWTAYIRQAFHCESSISNNLPRKIPKES